MCRREFRWRSWALLLALAFLLAGTSWAEEQKKTSTTPRWTDSIEPTQNESTQPTESWESLDALLTQLEAEATAQSEDLKKLLEQLAESQTEAQELSTLLGQSGLQFKSLEEALMKERDQARAALKAAIERGARAERSRDRWRLGAILTAVAGAAGWAAAVGLMMTL